MSDPAKVGDSITLNGEPVRVIYQAQVESTGIVNGKPVKLNFGVMTVAPPPQETPT